MKLSAFCSRWGFCNIYTGFLRIPLCLFPNAVTFVQTLPQFNPTGSTLLRIFRSPLIITAERLVRRTRHAPSHHRVFAIAIAVELGIRINQNHCLVAAFGVAFAAAPNRIRSRFRSEKVRVLREESHSLPGELSVFLRIGLPRTLSRSIQSIF